MEIGEYIRNKYGIAKIIDIKTNDEGIDICYFDNAIAFVFDTKLKEEKYRTHILPLTKNVDINKLKHSSNIIDLIEIGDYVNGSKVVDIAHAPTKTIYTEQKEACALIPITKDKLKSILTKEQFESMEYKIC